MLRVNTSEESLNALIRTECIRRNTCDGTRSDSVGKRRDGEEIGKRQARRSGRESGK